MILKRASARLRGLPRRVLAGRWALLGGGALLLASIAGAGLLGIGYGMYLHKVKVADSLATLVENAVQTRLAVVPQFIAGRLGPDPERLTIDVKHKDFQKLAHKRAVALERGLLLTEADDYVPAKVRHGERTVKVKIRLKGDWVDHLVGEKWSFRLRVRGGETLFGMREFSIHHPKTRHFVHEWIYHRALAREGVIPLRYDFVEVTLNGKNLGVYALEEHFDRRLIEHNGHREGPVLRFNESSHWADLAAHGRKGEASPTGLQAERSATIDGFNLKSLQQDPVLWGRFQTGVSLLEQFRAGRLATSQVFDIEKLAAQFAISDLMGARHALMWMNLRFYYNPITSLLEPVGFDGNAGEALETPSGANRRLDADIHKFKDVAFRDPRFVEAYVAMLEKVSQPAYLEALFEDIDPELERNLRILYREFPYLHFDRRQLFENQTVIRSVLEPVTGIHAYLGGRADGRLQLELGNPHALPVELIGVTLDDGRWLRPAQRVLVQPGLVDQPTPYLGAELPLPEAWEPKPGWERALEVHYRLLGSDRLRRDAVLPWTRGLDGFVEADVMRRPPNVESFGFLEPDEAEGVIRVRMGRWRIDRDLVVPPGRRLLAGPGTVLDLQGGAKIVSFSPLEFVGSEEAPLRVESSDGTGQGLLVLRAAGTSRLEHVRFHNLSNPEEGAWSLTGAVTFYESPVEIRAAQFTANRSEDALNVVRSRFRIERALFRDTRSDAFDADFADGEVTHTAFEHIGNDAIDVSGSDVVVRDVVVDGSGDKGISAGENARLRVERVRVQRARIGAASKDWSRLSGQELRIASSEIGLAVFRKKSEFGPATAELERLALDRVQTPYLVEQGSTVQVDGRVVEPNGERFRDVLYGVKDG